MDIYNLKIGDKIRVRIKGATKGSTDTADPAMLSTTQITDKTDSRWTHYVYLGSSGTSQTFDGDVNVEFDAEITGDIRGSQAITTQVNELSPSGRASGCTHFIYLGSDCVTALPAPEPPRIPVNESNAKIGSKVRFKITGQITGSRDYAQVGATTLVQEKDGDQWSHLLYLGSDNVTAAEADYGNDVTAEFNAEITGEYGTGNVYGCTEVRELDGTRYTHYLYLGSRFVSLLPENPTVEEVKPAEQPRVPVNSLNGRKDAKIRVKFTGVTTGRREVQANATTLVQEEDAGERRTHLLYVGTAGSTGATIAPDGRTVTAEFDAVITGEYGLGDLGTTAVRQLSGGIAAYTHYVFLGSEFVSLLPEDPAEVQAASEETISVAEAEAALIEAVRAPETTKGTTVSIDRYDDEISYSMVQNRIEDLESDTETTYTVVRDRNDEELAQFGDEDDARQYIEDNDYNPERVLVRESEPDQADVDELEMLSVLNSDCESEFSRAWKDEEVTLYREDYFDADWAKSEATDLLNISTRDLDTWPLDLIDWDEARDQRLENDYIEISFDNATFYGRNV